MPLVVVDNEAARGGRGERRRLGRRELRAEGDELVAREGGGRGGRAVQAQGSDVDPVGERQAAERRRRRWWPRALHHRLQLLDPALRRTDLHGTAASS